MPTKIILKKSSVVGKEPLATDLDVGELAVNLADGKLYSKNTSNVVITVGGQDFVGGTGISITGDTITNTSPHIATNLGITGTGNTRTITSSTGSNVTIPAATTTTAGLMATGDKSKLDGIQAGAQVNVATNLGYTASTRVLTSSTGTNVTLPQVTTSDDGLMTAADKSKLNSVATGATANTGTVTSVTGGDGLSGTVTTTGSLAVDGTVVRTSGNQTRTSGLLELGDSAFAGQLRIHRTGGSNYSVIQYFSGGNEVGKLGFTGSGALVARTLSNSSDQLTLSTAGVLSTSGGFSGNGSGLTTLNASNLSTGTVATARLPAAALIGDTTYSAGAGLSLSGTTFTNTAPHIATNLGSSGTGATRTITSSTGTNTSITYSAADIGAAPTSHTHTLAQITDSGTVAAINTNGSTANYLRGDGSWVTPPNTTYAAMSVAEGQAGTATASRTVRADYLKQIIEHYTSNVASAGMTKTTSAGSKTLAVNEDCYFSVTGTATLPLSPADNSEVKISVGNFSTLVIARNGELLMGLSENLTMNQNYSSVLLRYINSTIGWVLV